MGTSTASVDPMGRFDGTATLASGTNTVPITAVDANANTKTQNYQVVVADGSNSLSYDANGNLLNDGTNTYEWDAANRLTAINYTHSGNRSEFSYDPLGRRSKIVEKSNGTVSGEKDFVWSGLELCEERDSSSNVTRRFYPQGEQIAGVGYFYARDHLGSIRHLTDGTGTVQARYNYDLWGNRSANLVSGTGTVESEFGFTGHYFHGPSGLHLAPFRAYSSSMGRWISRDPIAEQGGINLYEYGRNSPTTYIDRDGKSPIVVGLVVTAAPIFIGLIKTTYGGADMVTPYPYIPYVIVGNRPYTLTDPVYQIMLDHEAVHQSSLANYLSEDNAYALTLAEAFRAYRSGKWHDHCLTSAEKKDLIDLIISAIVQRNDLLGRSDKPLYLLGL